MEHRKRTEREEGSEGGSYRERPVMAGEPRPPPRRDTEKGVGRGRVPGGGAGVRRFAMTDEEEEGLERDARAHERGREQDGVGDGPGLDGSRVYRRSSHIARYRAGGPEMACRVPNLNIVRSMSF